MKLEKLSLSLFAKNELEKKSMSNLFGGRVADPTTKHSPTYLTGGDGVGHYDCDHSADIS